MFYSENRVDFQRCRALIKEFCMDNLVTAASEERLFEFDIRDRIVALHPEIGGLALITFLGMLFEGLLHSGRQIGFQREGARSVFYGLKLREDGDNAVRKAERPTRTYRRVSEAGDTDDTIMLFEGHIEEDEKGKIRLMTLKKLHAVLNISEDFDDVVDRLENVDGISLKKIRNKETGKLNKYLKGLAITDSGEKLLAQQ